MTDVVLVKLGGSLLTEKARPRTARPEVIGRLAGEIAAALRGMEQRVLVGHGSGSFGHVAAARAELGAGPVEPERLAAGVAETRAEAAELHWMVVGALREAGLSPFSMPPGSCLIGRASELEGPLPEALPLALRAGLLPVVYGDAVLDAAWGGAIASTEAVFAFLAPRLTAAGCAVRRALWLGRTDGLLDAGGRTVLRVDPERWEEVAAAVGEPEGADVTGGMRLRLGTAALLASQGIPSLLANGEIPGLLTRALRGEKVPGTVVG